MVAGGDRHPRPEVFPQGRRAGAPEAVRGEAACRPGCGASVADERALDELPESERYGGETDAPRRCSTAWPAPGPTGAGRAAISTPRRTRAPSTTSIATCWRRRWRAPNSPQWFNTGLHWAYGIDGPAQGHYYVDHATGEVTASTSRLRAPAAARLLHPVGRRRSRQRGRHHGPVGPRGAPVQVRLRHGHQLLDACAARASGCRAAASPPA